MDGEIDRGTAGFTLIELMIVITVLSVLTVTVSLGVNRPRSSNAQDWSRFETVHAAMREQAVLRREVLGLSIDPDGYQRLRRVGGQWQEMSAAVHWRDSVTVQQPFDPRTRVVFLPVGQSTKLRLVFKAGTAVRICESDGWGPARCRAG
ncbi:MAG: prepilin-type N-terminal cleavage/methylation domain-containing protein [Rhodobacter sp.]|nr:prepilin-type N-terminal cleavage/methylation domain-containing protein [Rhodobacter sp.]